jgi:hypothetical protein
VTFLFPYLYCVACCFFVCAFVFVFVFVCCCFFRQRYFANVFANFEASLEVKTHPSQLNSLRFTICPCDNNQQKEVKKFSLNARHFLNETFSIRVKPQHIFFQ